MKAIVLVRVSTLKQHLDKQREEVIQLAKNDGFKEEDIIVIENKESAIKIKDESESLGLTQMFNLIENDPSIKCVYAYELSRIGRKEKVNITVKDFLVEHKVNLKIKEPSFSLLERDGSLNTSTELVFSLFNTMATQEMRLKKVRLARGVEEAKARGEIGKGICLFGYYVGKDKKIYINEEEGKVVRYIFTSYKNGMTPQKIFMECYERGWMTRKNNTRTETSTINAILSEPQYMGTVTENGVVRYPQMISKELWEEVAALRKANRRQKKNTRNIYLGLGIMSFNGKNMCGKDMKQYTTIDKSFTISCQLAEYILWKVAKELKNRSETINSMERLREIDDTITELDEKMDGCQKHIEELMERQHKVEEIYIMTNKSKDWLEKQLVNIDREIDSVQQKLNVYSDRAFRLKESLIRSEGLDPFASIISSGELDVFYDTREKRKDLVHEQIDKVVFQKGEVFREVWIESKRFGLLPYYFEYLTKGGKVILFRSKINKENGHKIRFKDRYCGRVYKKSKGIGN